MASAAGHTLDREFVKRFVGAAVTGVLAYIAGCKVATWLVNFIIPGAGFLPAAGVSSALNGIFTLKFGSVVADSMDKGTFQIDDAAKAATAVLAALCTLPTISEWTDLIKIRRSS
jgi:hypothetical protein